MDFLDSLDLHTNNHKQEKKLDRIRSWYLFEQYKSLEQHQLEAAQRLRDRSLQERLLQRELQERHSRRRLYQSPVAGCRSEPQRTSNANTCLSTTTDDFYESFHELHEDFLTSQSEHSHHDSDNTFMEDFKLEEFQDDTSCESVPSVVDLAVAGDKPLSCQNTIADSIKLHLETVKENIVSLERYARMADGDKSSDCTYSIPSARSKPDKVHYKDALLRDSQLFCMWSRLVTFAYQIVQMNHGNCYYDCSSQLLTAVLACDALRRGVNRMCDILQYYVSPIKYSSDNSDVASSPRCKKMKKEKSHMSKKIPNTSKYKRNSKLDKTYVTRRSEGYHHPNGLRWQRRRYSFEHKERRKSTRQPWSEEWHRAEWSHSSTVETLWPDELNEFERSRHCHKVQNPMLKLVQHLDDSIKSDMNNFGQRL